MMMIAVAVAVLVSVASAGGVNVSSLSINPGHSKAAKLTLGNADEGFMVKMEPGATGSFQIVHRDNPIFSIDSAGAVMVNGVLNSKGAFKTEGSVSFMGTPQWQLAKIENFEEGAKGWSNQSTTSCGSKMLLGGCEKFVGGETTKTYTGLPEHAQVRLKGNYYMIDSWGGETGYAKIEDHIVWTHSMDQQATKAGINICCGPEPESMHGAPMDIIFPHTDSFLKVAFGSTISGGGGKKAFWGVDNVQIYTRKA